MTKRKISAEIIAGSLNEHGQKITTWILTYPRIIHAEMMTHRVFSRNAASSRAIPALKLIADVEADPFVPVAFQKEHKGMQGTEYIEETHLVRSTWIEASKNAVASAKAMTNRDECTKQLTNRLLEPFQWYTAIFTSTETSNFFNLRCPQYTFPSGQMDDYVYKSRKDFLSFVPLPMEASDYDDWTDLDWLKRNKGQGEIHISLLAEAMWDSMNEYEYKQLKAGEWHIPFSDRFDTNLAIRAAENCGLPKDTTADEVKIKIATARCARVSYNNFEGKDDYEADIDLFGRLLTRPYTALNGDTYSESDPKHMSPSEHCAKAGEDDSWSGNFRGFVQLRAEL